MLMTSTVSTVSVVVAVVVVVVVVVVVAAEVVEEPVQKFRVPPNIFGILDTAELRGQTGPQQLDSGHPCISVLLANMQMQHVKALFVHRYGGPAASLDVPHAVCSLAGSSGNECSLCAHQDNVQWCCKMPNARKFADNLLCCVVGM